MLALFAALAALPSRHDEQINELKAYSPSNIKDAFPGDDRQFAGTALGARYTDDINDLERSEQPTSADTDASWEDGHDEHALLHALEADMTDLERALFSGKYSPFNNPPGDDTPENRRAKLRALAGIDDIMAKCEATGEKRDLGAQFEDVMYQTYVATKQAWMQKVTSTTPVDQSEWTPEWFWDQYMPKECEPSEANPTPCGANWPQFALITQDLNAYNTPDLPKLLLKEWKNAYSSEPVRVPEAFEAGGFLADDGKGRATFVTNAINAAEKNALKWVKLLLSPEKPAELEKKNIKPNTYLAQLGVTYELVRAQQHAKTHQQLAKDSPRGWGPWGMRSLFARVRLAMHHVFPKGSGNNLLQGSWLEEGKSLGTLEEWGLELRPAFPVPCAFQGVVHLTGQTGYQAILRLAMAAGCTRAQLNVGDPEAAKLSYISNPEEGSHNKPAGLITSEAAFAQTVGAGSCTQLQVAETILAYSALTKKINGVGEKASEVTQMPGALKEKLGAVVEQCKEDAKKCPRLHAVGEKGLFFLDAADAHKIVNAVYGVVRVRDPKGVDQSRAGEMEDHENGKWWGDRDSPNNLWPGQRYVETGTEYGCNRLNVDESLEYWTLVTSQLPSAPEEVGSAMDKYVQTRLQSWVDMVWSIAMHISEGKKDNALKLVRALDVGVPEPTVPNDTTERQAASVLMAMVEVFLDKVEPDVTRLFPAEFPENPKRFLSGESRAAKGGILSTQSLADMFKDKRRYYLRTCPAREKLVTKAKQCSDVKVKTKRDCNSYYVDAEGSDAASPKGFNKKGDYAQCTAREGAAVVSGFLKGIFTAQSVVCVKGVACEVIEVA